MKTCEEYVLNELENAKKELALVKKAKEELEKAKEELEDEYQLALTEHKMLIDLVVQGTEYFRLEDDGTYVKVYFNDSYVTLENNRDLGELEGLVNLILKGRSIVRREENE